MESRLTQLQRSALMNEEQSQLQILQLQNRIDALASTATGAGGTGSTGAGTGSGGQLRLVEVENMLAGLEPEVDSDCNKGNGKRGKHYLTDGTTVQPPHSNGRADRFANSDYWHGCANNAANAEAKFTFATTAAASSPNFVTEVRISNRCDKMAVAARRMVGATVFVGTADGSEVQCGEALTSGEAEGCSTAVVQCGLVANAVYVVVRGNGAEPLNLVEVQAKGKVATAEEADGHRSLSQAEEKHSHAQVQHSHPHPHPHPQKAGAAAEQQQQQQMSTTETPEQPRQQLPSTTMAAFVGAALAVMGIGLVVGIVRVVRSVSDGARAPSLLPTAAPALAITL